jgi:hypothetical protein
MQEPPRWAEIRGSRKFILRLPVGYKLVGQDAFQVFFRLRTR